MDCYSEEKPQTLAPQSQALKTVSNLYNKHRELAQLFTKERLITAVGGGESSGKSSLINQLYGIKIAPYGEGTTTVVPMIIVAVTGNSKKFSLREKGQLLLESDDVCDIYGYVEKEDEKKRPVYNRIRQLFVNADAFPIAVLDLPGYLAGSNQEDQQRCCVSPQDGTKTSLVIATVSAVGCHFNVMSDRNMADILETAYKNNIRALLVITHCDVLLTCPEKNRVERLIESVRNLKERLREDWNGFEFTAVLVQCKRSRGVFDYEETRIEEKKIWIQIPELKEAKDYDSTPLFQCGLEYARNVIFGGPFASADVETFAKAEGVAARKIQDLNAKISMGTENFRPFIMYQTIPPALKKQAAISTCQVEFQTSLIEYLRKLCSDIFDERPQPQPSPGQNTTISGPAQISEEDIKQKDIETYRREANEYIRRLSTYSGGIFAKAVESLRKHVDVVFSEYVHHEQFYRWLFDQFDSFVASKKENLIETLKTRIQEHLALCSVAETQDFIPFWKSMKIQDAAKNNLVVRKLFASLETIIRQMQLNILLKVSTDLFQDFPEKLGREMVKNPDLELRDLTENQVIGIQSDIAELNYGIIAFRELRVEYSALKPSQGQKRKNENKTGPEKKQKREAERDNDIGEAKKKTSWLW